MKFHRMNEGTHIQCANLFNIPAKLYFDSLTSWNWIARILRIFDRTPTRSTHHFHMSLECRQPTLHTHTNCLSLVFQSTFPHIFSKPKMNAHTFSVSCKALNFSLTACWWNKLVWSGCHAQPLSKWHAHTIPIAYVSAAHVFIWMRLQLCVSEFVSNGNCLRLWMYPNPINNSGNPI